MNVATAIFAVLMVAAIVYLVFMNNEPKGPRAA